MEMIEVMLRAGIPPDITSSFAAIHTSADTRIASLYFFRKRLPWVSRVIACENYLVSSSKNFNRSSRRRQLWLNPGRVVAPCRELSENVLDFDVNQIVLGQLKFSLISLQKDIKRVFIVATQIRVLFLRAFGNWKAALCQLRSSFHHIVSYVGS
ncbi:hypothetical protein H4582DRAFT_476438 [Lactarius indigo]|nr:hypothetical protein H4582DRAFT_476438 [Lactarius indigo]